jgi:hypothetical protein
MITVTIKVFLFGLLTTFFNFCKQYVLLPARVDVSFTLNDPPTRLISALMSTWQVWVVSIEQSAMRELLTRELLKRELLTRERSATRELLAIRELLTRELLAIRELSAAREW